MGEAEHGTPGRPGDQHITVRTDVVRAVLVEDVWREVEQRMEDPLAEAVTDALADTLATVLPSQTAPVSASVAAARVARAGYLARVIECERFARAREPADELASVALGSWPDGAVELSAELARAEPAERPRPDDPPAMTWRIPGPGGHVRHYLALAAVEAERPVLGLSETDLKGCWLFGFFLRACEELSVT